MNNEFKQKFYNIYTKEILPQIDETEKERKTRLHTLSALYFITAAMLFASIIGFLNNFTLYPFFIIIFVVLVITAVYCTDDSRKKFKLHLKPILTSLLKSFGNITWNRGTLPNIISKNLIKSELFSSFNNINCDDTFLGQYNGVKFSLAETELRDIHGSGKSRTDFRTFKGVILVFDANKKFQGKTIITSKNDKNIRNNTTGGSYITLRYLLPGVAFIFALIFGHTFDAESFIYSIIGIGCLIWFGIERYINWRKLQDVKLEDVEFDRNFCVASTDQIESRYLITPSFMERLKTISTAYGSDKIKCSFFEDKIMFAITTKKDLFEAGSLYLPMTNSKHINRLYDEIVSIYEMIDYFKLNEKTGL